MGSPRHRILPVTGLRRGSDSEMDSFGKYVEVKRRSTQSLCVLDTLRTDSQRRLGSICSKICNDISSGRSRVCMDIAVLFIVDGGDVWAL